MLLTRYYRVECQVPLQKQILIKYYLNYKVNRYSRMTKTLKNVRHVIPGHSRGLSGIGLNEMYEGGKRKTMKNRRK